MFVDYNWNIEYALFDDPGRVSTPAQGDIVHYRVQESMRHMMTS